MTFELHKKELERELEKLQAELKTLGHVNPKNANDWEADPQALDIDQADENELADKIESFGENTAILDQLEIRALEVKNALKRIQEGNYGKCEVCGKPIEEERLAANYAASTCIEHIK